MVATSTERRLNMRRTRTAESSRSLSSSSIKLYKTMSHTSASPPTLSPTLSPSLPPPLSHSLSAVSSTTKASWFYPSPSDVPAGDAYPFTRKRQRRKPEATGPVNVVVVDSDWAHESEAEDESWKSESAEQDKEKPTVGSHAGEVMRGAVQAVKPFASLVFADRELESQFQSEQWATVKKSALLGSVFIIFAWVLRTGLRLHWTPTAYGTLVGICGFFILPLPLMVLLNLPTRAPWLYQPFLCVAVWAYGLIQTIEMKRCGFFEANDRCQDRFLYLYGTLFSLPTVGLLGLRQNRILHIAAALAYLVASFGILLTGPQVPRMWIGNPITLLLFHMYLAMHSYYREKADRQLFLTRQQLVLQYRAAQDAQDKMLRADLSKKQFVSYIFHEVRVPLNTATLAVQNLHSDGVFDRLDHDDDAMYHGLISSLGMMENVLNDVLSFNRMESGQLTLARKPFNLHQSMRLVAMSHRAQAEMTGVRFITQLDPRIDNLGVVIGDEMRLKQLVSNLVSNALKFTHAGSVTLVTQLLRTDTYPDSLGDGDTEKGSVEHEKTRFAVVRVEVRDTGVGLGPADVENNKLFSPYVQTEIGRRQGGKGSGLGLALVQQLVRLCRGRLGVDSELGKGSTFWFELQYPIGRGLVLPDIVETSESRRTSLKVAPIPPQPKPALRQAAPVSALVVDDDPLTRTLMARIIAREGHTVATAEDGEAALEMIKQGRFDVVFLDNQMPRKSGVEVVREVRALGMDLYIVGCTGNALKEDQEEYLAAGADEVLTKPVHRVQVVAKLDAAGRNRVERGEKEQQEKERGEEKEQEQKHADTTAATSTTTTTTTTTNTQPQVNR